MGEGMSQEGPHGVLLGYNLPAYLLKNYSPGNYKYLQKWQNLTKAT